MEERTAVRFFAPLFPNWLDRCDGSSSTLCMKNGKKTCCNMLQQVSITLCL